MCTSQYTIIDDPSRNYQAPGGCRDDGILLEGWYRFKMNGVDAKMPDYTVTLTWQRGGTERGGKVSTLNPSISDGIVDAQVWFEWSNGVNVPIKIVSCGVFLLYYHTPYSSPNWGGLGGCNGAPFGYVLQTLL